MNKKVIAIISVIILLSFIGYMIYDSINQRDISKVAPAVTDETAPADAWQISNEFKVEEGHLKAVASSDDGLIFLGGSSFVSCYDSNLKKIWEIKTDSAVTALSVSGDTIFAATRDQILVIGKNGKPVNEWGPFEDNSFITSVSSNNKYVAYADAGNKLVYILDKGGEVLRIVGKSGEKFVIPSPYFDVALDGNNTLYTANTGNHRIETRSIDGNVISYFGEPGTAPQYFCGCCAPAHFILVPGGYVTAEKGINRIKILDTNGAFIEFVNSRNSFIKSEPLDLASPDGKTIYAAYPADSKLYVFKKK